MLMVSWMLVLLVAIAVLGLLVLSIVFVPKVRALGLVMLFLLFGGGFVAGFAGLAYISQPLAEAHSYTEFGTTDDSWGIANLSENGHSPEVVVEKVSDSIGEQPKDQELGQVAELAEENFESIEDMAVAADEGNDDLKESKLVLKQPDWLTSPPEQVDGRPAVVVRSAQWETTWECEDELRGLVHKEAMRFATNAVYSNRVNGPAEFRLSSTDFQQLVRDEYEEEVETSVGPMKRVHQLIVFDDEFEGSLRDRYHQVAVEKRLSQAGFMSGGVFLFLMTVFGFLKVSSRQSRKEAR